MNNSNKKTKQIMFKDETCKTLNRIQKKVKISAKHELRKQLCNDDLLKNYFVLNPEKDETVVFRIDGSKSFESEQLIVTKHVSTSPPKINNLQSANYNHEQNQLFETNIIRNETQQPEETTNTIHNHQQQFDLFLLQLCCALMDQGQNRNFFQ
ncbi:predicted protein [Naegleria gruberi]|uniref:Predicted protein n=1 Tax=Naegleria gruberi TaxID=5762 RepID=D2VQ17_NAEGR|nr:uncharacterized protein NAEGRDRAFT_71130 [Naegleria gruberi]EFC41098.1 predicted protein [Naegleria gruberi]|eukprot:XP_002673842.1 predicted protein [Naegleria gruberi strain NEG-M]